MRKQAKNDILSPAVSLQEMIDEADRDGDGEVSLEEFERIMKVSTDTSCPPKSPL